MNCFLEKKIIKLYDLAVVLMTLKVMLDKLIYIDNDLIDNWLILLGVGMFIVSFIFETKHSLIEYIVVGALGIVCLYSCLKMREFYLLMTYFLVIASIDKDLIKTVRLMRNVKLSVIFVSVLWYILAYFVFHDTLYVIVRDGRIAHHFGFSHPNAFALIVGWVCLETLYLSYGNYKNRLYIFFPVIGLLLYYFTCCNSVMYIMFGATILLVLGRIRVFQKPIHMVAQCIFPIIAIGNAFCIITYNKRGGFLYDFVYDLDKLITARIRQAAYIMEDYGVTLLGHGVPMGEEVTYDSYYRLSTIMCDGLFSYFLVCSGFLFTVLFSVAIYYVVKRKKEYSIIAIVYAIYGILETHGINAFMVYPILIFGAECLTRLHNEYGVHCEKENETDENHTCTSSGPYI